MRVSAAAADIAEGAAKLGVAFRSCCRICTWSIKLGTKAIQIWRLIECLLEAWFEMMEGCVESGFDMIVPIMAFDDT